MPKGNALSYKWRKEQNQNKTKQQTLKTVPTRIMAYLTCQSLSGLPLFIRRKGDIPPVTFFITNLSVMLYVTSIINCCLGFAVTLSAGGQLKRSVHLHKNPRSRTWKYLLRKHICCLEGISWYFYALHSCHRHIPNNSSFEAYPRPCFTHNGILPRFRRISQCKKHWKAEKRFEGITIIFYYLLSKVLQDSCLGLGVLPFNWHHSWWIEP